MQTWYQQRSWQPLEEAEAEAEAEAEEEEEGQQQAERMSFKLSKKLVIEGKHVKFYKCS